MAGGLALLIEKMGKKKTDEGDEADAPEGEGADTDKIRSLAEEAFPNEDWSDDRLTALHELIRACGGAEY